MIKQTLITCLMALSVLGIAHADGCNDVAVFIDNRMGQSLYVDFEANGVSIKKFNLPAGLMSFPLFTAKNNNDAKGDIYHCNTWGKFVIKDSFQTVFPIFAETVVKSYNKTGTHDATGCSEGDSARDGHIYTESVVFDTTKIKIVSEEKKPNCEYSGVPGKYTIVLGPNKPSHLTLN